MLLNDGYILPNSLATGSPSWYLKIFPKEKPQVKYENKRTLQVGMDLAGFHDRLSCPFRTYLRRWESQNVLAHEIIFGTETNKQTNKRKL